MRTFYAAYTEEQGKPRWGEKTPTYVQKMKLIQRAIPEARFVHVIRDGRDVALSVLDRTVRDLTAGDIAKRWQKKITKAREDSPKLDHYMEIRYEDLILDTEPVLRRVCEFIELPWDDALLTYHERSADRLQEMARALPAEGRAKELSVERRLETHEMTTKPPSADRVARWRTQMTRRAARGVRGRRRRPARRSSATRPAPTPSSGQRPRSKPRSFPTVRVGIVSKWFACGQAVVSRQIRSALDELGHETFVLAKQGKGPRAQPGAGRRPGLGPARGHRERARPTSRSAEYEAWVAGNSLDVVLTDQNDQFEEIAGAARGRRADDRPLRLGELRPRGRRAREGGLRHDLLVHQGRAGALRDASGSTARCSPGAAIPELLAVGERRPSDARRATRSGSTSPAASWASASRSPRSSRRSPAPGATTCGC